MCDTINSKQRFRRLKQKSKKIIESNGGIVAETKGEMSEFLHLICVLPESTFFLIVETSEPTEARIESIQNYLQSIRLMEYDVLIHIYNEYSQFPSTKHL